MSHIYELFITQTCPFCKKVQRYLADNNISIPLRDIANDPQALETLVRIGGKRQVPCLFIDGTPLYESDDIIAYLSTRKQS